MKVKVTSHSINTQLHMQGRSLQSSCSLQLLSHPPNPLVSCRNTGQKQNTGQLPQWTRGPTTHCQHFEPTHTVHMDSMFTSLVYHAKFRISDIYYGLGCRSQDSVLWSQVGRQNLRNVKQKRNWIKQGDIKFTEEQIRAKIKWKSREKAVSSYTYMKQSWKKMGKGVKLQGIKKRITKTQERGRRGRERREDQSDQGDRKDPRMWTADDTRWGKRYIGSIEKLKRKLREWLSLSVGRKPFYFHLFCTQRSPECDQCFMGLTNCISPYSSSFHPSCQGSLGNHHRSWSAWCIASSKGTPKDPFLYNLEAEKHSFETLAWNIKSTFFFFLNNPETPKMFSVPIQTLKGTKNSY